MTDFVCRCSLGVYQEYTPPAISALLSWEQEGTLGHTVCLPTSFLPTRGCVYHFLLNPGGKMRKYISLGSTCKAKAKSLLNTALLPLIFVTDNSACSSMCVGEKDKRLCPGFPSLPQGASWVWVRHLCTCRGRRPSRLQQRRSSSSAPLPACVVVQFLEGTRDAIILGWHRPMELFSMTEMLPI